MSSTSDSTGVLIAVERCTPEIGTDSSDGLLRLLSNMVIDRLISDEKNNQDLKKMELCDKLKK